MTFFHRSVSVFFLFIFEDLSNYTADFWFWQFPFLVLWSTGGHFYSHILGILVILLKNGRWPNILLWFNLQNLKKIFSKRLSHLGIIMWPTNIHIIELVVQHTQNSFPILYIYYIYIYIYIYIYVYYIYIIYICIYNPTFQGHLS